MARLSRERPAPPETEVVVRLPRRDPIGRAADDRGRALIYREPRRKGLFTRRQEWMHLLGVRCTQRRSIGDRHRSTWKRLGGVFRRRRRKRPFDRRDDRQGAVEDEDRRPPRSVITGSPTLVGTTLFVPVSSYEEATGARKSYSCCTFRGSLVAAGRVDGQDAVEDVHVAEAGEAEARPMPLAFS